MSHIESNLKDSGGGTSQIKLGLDRLRTPYAFALIALLSISCNRAVQKPPESSMKHAQRDAKEQTLTPEAREIPEHIAPPPAYGNKVVMAQGEGSSSF